MPGKVSGEEACRSLPGFAFQTRVLQWMEKMGRGIPKMPVDNTVKREKRFLQSSWLWDGRGRVNEGLGGGGGSQDAGSEGCMSSGNFGEPGGRSALPGGNGGPMSGWLQR